MKLYIVKFESRLFGDMTAQPSANVLRNSNANLALRNVWTLPTICEGGGDDDLRVSPNSPRSTCPWCLAAIKRPFFVPFYAEISNNPPIPSDFNELSREIARISQAAFTAKIKRAQTAFEKVEAQATGKAGEIRTDRDTKTETREYTDKIKALGGLAEPTRDAFVETRSGGGDTSVISGTLEASPAEQFENAAAGARVRSPYEIAADRILQFTIPADFRDNAEYYASIGADWWVYLYPEIFEAIEV